MVEFLYVVHGISKIYWNFYWNFTEMAANWSKPIPALFRQFSIGFPSFSIHPNLVILSIPVSFAVSVAVAMSVNVSSAETHISVRDRVHFHVHASLQWTYPWLSLCSCSWPYPLSRPFPLSFQSRPVSRH